MACALRHSFLMVYSAHEVDGVTTGRPGSEGKDSMRTRPRADYCRHRGLGVDGRRAGVVAHVGQSELRAAWKDGAARV